MPRIPPPPHPLPACETQPGLAKPRHTAPPLGSVGMLRPMVNYYGVHCHQEAPMPFCRSLLELLLLKKAGSQNKRSGKNRLQILCEAASPRQPEMGLAYY